MRLKKAGFILASGITFAVMLAVLELNQNTAVGFALAALFGAGFWILHRKVLAEKRWYWKLLGWLGWLLLFVCVLLLTWPPVRAVPAVEGRYIRHTDVVSIPQGDLQGVFTDDGAVEVYAGIPYAKPPVGELRWKEPQDPEPWEGVLAAEHFAPMSMQPTYLPIYNSLTQIIGYHDYKISLTDNYRPPVSEDSLYLNIWKPSGNVSGLPVLHSFRLLDEALESGRDLKARYGCSTVAELRALSAETLVGEADTQHHMTVDGYALTETPYESYRKGIHNEQEVLHGYNSRESGPFILFDQANLRNYEGKVRGYFKEYADEVLAVYPASTDAEAAACWAEIWGAVFFDYPHYCLNRLAVQNGIPAYEYYFSKENGRLGPWHSGEMIYCYGNIPEDSRVFDARDRELSGQMLRYWRNFIVTGDPNGDSLPAWERNGASAELMEFGATTGMIPEGEHALFDILDRMDGWSESW